MLVLIILYLIYKYINFNKIYEYKSTIENFETSIETVINDKYNTNIDNINNLSDLINDITIEKNLINIESDTFYVKDILVNGSFNIKQKDSMLLNIFQRNMIIAWNDDIIPLGWALCNGKRYSLDNNGTAIEDSRGILTPNLSGRFILGADIRGFDINNQDLNKKILGDTGGKETHVLTIEEMPSHEHSLHIYGGNRNYVSPYGATTISLSLSSIHDILYQNATMSKLSENYVNNISTLVKIRNKFGILRPNTGNKLEDNAAKNNPDPAIYDTKPHNNMPPYYVLTYIMKL